jgi:nucleoid DNA-binding protein
MEKFQFIEYIAKRYGIDESMAETMIDMFADTLQEIVATGQEVNIDEIGVFSKLPLFPHGINHQNKINLAKLSKKCMVSFVPSKLFNKTVSL